MSEAQPIIIKRIKKGGDGGHHGGAWKVAYADFVTAMMAFFLLMWLLNATSEEQRKGLADYFDPSLPISRTSAGGAGMLSGDSMMSEADAAGSRKEGVRPKPTSAEPGEDLGELEASPDWPESDVPPNSLPWRIDEETEQSEQAFQETAEPGDDAEANPGTADPNDMGGLEEDLLGTLVEAGESGLLEHFTMRMTPEGLVIELTDVTDEPLFRSGSVEPAEILGQLIEILVPVLQKTTNDIAIAGHTDAIPYTGSNGRSNWELSADRANAARQVFQELGLEENRIVRVSGHAAMSPIVDDPRAAQNRRIAITLLREPTTRPDLAQ